MTVVRTLAPTTFADGAQGVITHTNPLPPGLEIFIFRIQQVSGWVWDGQPAIQMAIQYAADGVNFIRLGDFETIRDEEFAYPRVPAGDWVWGHTIFDVGLDTRKMRMGYRFLKGGLRVTGTLEVL